MLDKEKFSNESPLVDGNLQQQLAGIFAKMENPVVMKAVINEDGEKDLELASFLRAIEKTSENLSVEFYTVAEAKEAVPELNTEYLPVTGLYKNGEYGRAAFHGVPGGKEINPFVLAIYNLAGPGQEIPKGVCKKINKLTKKCNIKVCTSLGCHHCPGVVNAAQQIAILNPNVEAEMFDAALYQGLQEKYSIKRVPFMIINDEETHMGSKGVEEILNLLKY